MANPDFQGYEYLPTAPYAVGREKIREFAAAVGATHRSHYDCAVAQSMGYSDLVAPPTFAVVVAQQAESQYVNNPAAGIDFSRVVHAEESFTHHRPIIAGDELSTVLHVDSITTRGQLAMVTTRCEIFTVSPTGTAISTNAPNSDASNTGSQTVLGHLVSTVTSTLAIRGE